MPCNPVESKHVPLFALLDDDEIAVLAAQVDLKTFAPRQRIYKMGDPGKHAYILMSGNVQVTTVDEDHQEVVVVARLVADTRSSAPSQDSPRIHSIGPTSSCPPVLCSEQAAGAPRVGG